MLLATFLTVFWVGAIGNYSLFTLTLLYAVGALSVPLAFIFLQFIYEDTKIGLTMVKHSSIKTIAYLALTSSLLNSIGQSVVLDGFSAFEVKPRIILQFLIGDLLGTLVLFLCLRFVPNRIKLS